MPPHPGADAADARDGQVAHALDLQRDVVTIDVDKTKGVAWKRVRHRAVGVIGQKPVSKTRKRDARHGNAREAQAVGAQARERLDLQRRIVRREVLGQTPAVGVHHERFTGSTRY